MSTSPAPSAQTSALFDDAFLRKLQRLDLLARKVFRGQVRGEHITARRGRGIEFSDFRRYRPGDDFRHIDWNIYSRLDKLFLKMYATEEDVSLHVLMDSSASMAVGEPTKFDHARRIGAALAYIGINNLDRVSFTTFSGGVGSSLPSLRSRHDMSTLLAMLDELVCEGRSDFGAAFRDFSVQIRHPGIVVLLSDLLGEATPAEDLRIGIESLRSRGHEVFVLQLLAEEEIDPPLDGAMRLVDAETGTAMNVTVDEQLRTLYHKQLDQRLRAVETYCMRRGIEYLRTSTAIGFEDVVLKYLRRSALLK